MTLKIVIGAIITTLLLSSQLVGTAFASGLSRSDIDTSPEGVCMNYGDEPDMKDLCDWINICDDTGEVNSTHGFCTGLAVSNPPGKERCPDGFHVT